MVTGSPEDIQARNRFALISAVRLFGVVTVLLGLLIVNLVVPAPAMIGYVLLAIGVVNVFLLPQILARKWRTPRQ